LRLGELYGSNPTSRSFEEPLHAPMHPGADQIRTLHITAAPASGGRARLDLALLLLLTGP